MNPPQSDRPLSIGALAERTGFNVSALRYYEEVGLIPPPMRRPSGHRVYDEKVQEVLTLVRHCRDLGFSIDETRALVALSTSDESDCVEARDIAQLHLDTVRSKLEELQRLERSLQKFVQACSDQCAGGPAPQCTILKDLGARDLGPAKPAGCCGSA
jgi:MerR family transcriptional regulator, copper efflux regulator